MGIDTRHIVCGLEFVPGIPAPKGSYRAVRTKTGKTRLVGMSKREREWRKRVAEHFYKTGFDPEPRSSALVVILGFVMPAPKTVCREFPTVPPDIDKLCRSTLDALQDSGIIPNDSQVVGLSATKVYVNRQDPEPGCYITVHEVDYHPDDIGGDECDTD